MYVCSSTIWYKTAMFFVVAEDVWLWLQNHVRPRLIHCDWSRPRQDHLGCPNEVETCLARNAIQSKSIKHVDDLLMLTKIRISKTYHSHLDFWDLKKNTKGIQRLSVSGCRDRYAT